MIPPRAVLERVTVQARSARLQLTLWYLAMVLTTLVVFALVIYVQLAHALRSDIDRSLDQVAEAMFEVNDGQPALDSDELLPGYIATLYAPDGRPLATAGASLPLPPPDADTLAAVGRDERVWRSAPVGNASWRIYTGPAFVNGQRIGVLQVARSEEPVDSLVDQLRRLVTELVPVVLLLAAAGGLFLAGRAFEPVDRITRTAAAISAEDLARRLPDHLTRTPGELGRLAVTFNRMLDRLEAAFQRQRRFTADASHELRTPLTLLLGQVDVALQRERSAGEYRETLTGLREDIIGLRRLIDVLLALARADAHQDVLAREPIDLTELIYQVADAMAPLANSRGVGLAVQSSAVQLIFGDQARLMQLLVNLVENALKYTPRGGNVTIAVTSESDARSAQISVRDTGTGIGPEHLPHIFERFYRVDPGRAAGGTGLGLAISSWIVQAHGGRIEVESKLGAGSTFRVVLPRTAAAA